ncbi:Uncharacterised protein [uncultured archaeon]|nr:Uncharacterised protein [uncultured archaeon]
MDVNKTRVETGGCRRHPLRIYGLCRNTFYLRGYNGSLRQFLDGVVAEERKSAEKSGVAPELVILSDERSVDHAFNLTSSESKGAAKSLWKA